MICRDLMQQSPLHYRAIIITDAHRIAASSRQTRRGGADTTATSGKSE